jgi:hypothetical protein
MVIFPQLLFGSTFFHTLAENFVNIKHNIQPLQLSSRLASWDTPRDLLHRTYLIININKQLELLVEMKMPHNAIIL